MKIKLSEITGNELQKMFDRFNTRAEILRELGHTPEAGGTYKTLKKYERILGIDLTIFNKHNLECRRKHASELGSGKKLAATELKKNRYINSPTLKRLMLENGIAYVCEVCFNDGFHLNAPLSLQIDHIDGDNHNNQKANLRFLCPNCHTQTPTYAARNIQSAKNKRAIKYKNVILREKSRIERINTIIDSGIDFNKYGWVTQVAHLLGISPQKVKPWMENNMRDFYKNKCFVRN